MSRRTIFVVLSYPFVALIPLFMGFLAVRSYDGFVFGAMVGDTYGAMAWLIITGAFGLAAIATLIWMLRGGHLSSDPKASDRGTQE